MTVKAGASRRYCAISGLLDAQNSMGDQAERFPDQIQPILKIPQCHTN